ncbi:MAG: low molecular weight phosphotyrosine protein phosphatase [Bacteroidales bacterium]|nr:low molecular weight phosphotyrosine protein phosphatase [Bacteroidales bacterium]
MKILFVCLGNICRSPLAEGILKKKIEEYGISGIIHSAGFEPYHEGQHPDPRSVATAKNHDIDISGKTARLFTLEDFDNYDKILVMDAMNYADVMRNARNGSDRSKVDYLLNLINEGSDDEVPDPYYGGPSGFDKVFDMMDRACDRIVKDLLN